MFCISIVQDLFQDRFKTNEKGIIKYENNISEKTY